jgi:Pol polyprotein, beta-barrel domain/GAG-pre-integrase domain
MAFGNHNPSSPLPNNNHAYNQSVRSRDEDFFALAEFVSTTPLSSEESSFVLSTSATYHISPKLSDFKTLAPIFPCPVKVLSGTCLYAVGIGSIDVHTDISTGHKLTLRDVLFVPFARARLISSQSLCLDGMYTIYFGPESCWITDNGGRTVVRGTVLRNNLYVLSIDPFATHFDTAPLQQAHTHMHASQTPDIETWHRRLGHCDTQTIIDMARNHVVDGMTIDLSMAPPKCHSCLLENQTCFPKPEEREGTQAKRPLERVYIDLWGPMTVTSRSGRLYAMVVVDDFSSYVWVVPLISKDEVARSLSAWKCSVENLSDCHLKTLVTKDGGPISRSMADWCAFYSIEYQVTAPTTSGNRRTDCLRLIILGKARTMLLACNAPRSLWDEFLSTAVYLTTLTASVYCDGKTPYELCKGRAPTLSHLREIGCLAFALIATPNADVYQCSELCILIGYEPHVKEYRLWDFSSGKVYKTLHVLFIEHLEAVPADLQPGATLRIASTSALPSLDAPVSAPVYTVIAVPQPLQIV